MTVLAKQSTVAVFLSVIMIMSTGCTGWEFSVYEEEETDGNGETQTQEDPADDDQETTVDDPETDQEMADDSEDSGDPPEESKNENEEIENGPDAIPADETSKRWDGDEERLTCDAFNTQEDAQAYFDENPRERLS